MQSRGDSVAAYMKHDTGEDQLSPQRVNCTYLLRDVATADGFSSQRVALWLSLSHAISGGIHNETIGKTTTATCVLPRPHTANQFKLVTAEN
jgi:hypothetical protein